ncbi:MAG TPA: hypothetical protein PKB02_06235 [Anaerohalosphaeraceae bacterium]|nr:hypothetical protein [Anaerohalosphaeraceae bacterium]
MQIKSKITILILLVCIALSIILLLPKLKAIYEDFNRQKNFDRRVAEALSPQYKQSTILRIMNIEPNEIRNLQVNYENGGFKIDRLAPGFMYRHEPIITSLPVVIEYSYMIDNYEYKQKIPSFQPEGEIGIVLKKDKIEMWPIQNPDPNDKYGISKSSPIIYNWGEED